MIVNDLVINTHTGSLDTIYVLERVAATNSNTNHFGLPSTSIVMDKVFITYPYINEWKTNLKAYAKMPGKGACFWQKKTVKDYLAII